MGHDSIMKRIPIKEKKTRNYRNYTTDQISLRLLGINGYSGFLKHW